MKNFHTAVLERNKKFCTDSFTHPYECGWASEAIFFIDVTRFEGTESNLVFTVQLSADGLKWVDEGSQLEIRQSGLSFIRVSHFGGWLRLKLKTIGSNVSAETTIQLVLKE